MYGRTWPALLALALGLDQMGRPELWRDELASWHPAACLGAEPRIWVVGNRHQLNPYRAVTPAQAAALPAEPGQARQGSHRVPADPGGRGVKPAPFG
jgi:hypothetical protein